MYIFGDDWETDRAGSRQDVEQCYRLPDSWSGISQL